VAHFFCISSFSGYICASGSRTRRASRNATTPRRVLFDLDSTLLTLYGHQEKARRGYNPRKRGRPSYHPLVCFEGQTRGELRPGDIHTATGTVWLLRACIDKVPAAVRQIRVRADAGFLRLQDRQDDRGAARQVCHCRRLTPPLKRLVTGLAYAQVGRDLAVAECQYQPHGWPQPYRFVVVRKTLPEEETSQTPLFTSGRYSYHAFVTNFRIRPITVYRFYNARAAVELIIKELKADYPLAKIPTGQFAANEAYFHLLLFGYNLMNWWKRLCLPASYHTMTLGTLRPRFFWIPAEAARLSQGVTLRFPPALPDPVAIKHAFDRTAHLRI
jgi:hypothetical protein